LTTVHRAASKDYSFSIKFKVLGKDWLLRPMQKRRYAKKHGKDSVAITRTDKRIVYLSPYGRDLETITHELVHCYRYEMCLESMIEITVDDMEEYYAEFISKFGHEILDLAEILYDQVRELISKKI
jgi:hypothetical protein